MQEIWEHLAIPSFLTSKRRNHLIRKNCCSTLWMKGTWTHALLKVCRGLRVTHVDMDWCWLVQNACLHRRQNRLGFVVALAIDLARPKRDNERLLKLRQQLEKLESIRLAEEDTLCRDSMTITERAWLRAHRSPTAAHWNILSDLTGREP